MTTNTLDKTDKFSKDFATEYSKVFLYLNAFLSKTILSPQHFLIAVAKNLGYYIPNSRKKYNSSTPSMQFNKLKCTHHTKSFFQVCV